MASLKEILKKQRASKDDIKKLVKQMTQKPNKQQRHLLAEALRNAS